MKDHEVKEKLESLSPLAGGVVFGKEEAWDKLQARLEKKPARKIPIIRLSVAAILLLGIGIGTYNYLHQPVAIDLNEQLTTVAPAPPNLEPVVIEQPPVSITAETVRVVSTITPVRKEILPTKETKVIEQEPVHIAPIMPDPQPVAVNEPEKPKVSLKTMRVVHINDIGKPEDETVSAYVYNGPALDISKMKVVSLNDVQREESLRKQEEEIITMIRINRPHGGFLGFTNTVGWGNNAQRTYAQNPLSIRLNRNN